MTVIMFTTWYKLVDSLLSTEKKSWTFTFAPWGVMNINSLFCERLTPVVQVNAAYFPGVPLHTQMQWEGNNWVSHVPIIQKWILIEAHKIAVKHNFT